MDGCSHKSANRGLDKQASTVEGFMASNANGQEEKRHLREYERSDFSSAGLPASVYFALLPTSSVCLAYISTTKLPHVTTTSTFASTISPELEVRI